jgi:hypothetical protein
MGAKYPTADGSQIPWSENRCGEGYRCGLVNRGNSRDVPNLVFRPKGHQTAGRHSGLLLPYKLSCRVYEIDISTSCQRIDLK